MSKSMETENRLGVARGWGRGEWGVSTLWVQSFHLGQGMKIFWNWIVVMVTPHCGTVLNATELYTLKWLQW